MSGVSKRLRQETPLALFYLLSMVAGISLAIFTHRERLEWWEGYLVWGFPTLLGVLAGQAAYLLRLRTWIVLFVAIGWWIGGYHIFPSLLLQQEWFPGKEAHPLFPAGLGPTFLWYMTLWMPLFSLGGLFSLRRPWGVLACWFPIVFFVKATIPFINLDQEWLEGKKWAVWTPATFLVAVTCVGLFLFFLAWRERRRIGSWSTQRPQAWTLQGGGRTLWRRVIETLVLVLLLSASTALISPFLWNRLRAREGTESQQSAGSSGQGESQPPSGEGRPAGGSSTAEGESQSQSSPPPPSPGQQPSPPHSGQQAGQGEQGGGETGSPPPSSGASPESEAEGEAPADSSDEEEAPGGGGGAGSGAAQRFLPWLFLLFLWLLLQRPLRRLRLVRGWLQPDRKRSPTDVIENAWKAVATVLQDHRQSPRPSETPETFTERLERSWPTSGSRLEALSKLAQIRDRVYFGLFVQPGDRETSLQLAREGYQQLWAQQTAWQKLRSLYRDLE